MAAFVWNLVMYFLSILRVAGCGSVILFTKISLGSSEPHRILSGEFLLLKNYKILLF